MRFAGDSGFMVESLVVFMSRTETGMKLSPKKLVARATEITKLLAQEAHTFKTREADYARDLEALRTRYNPEGKSMAELDFTVNQTWRKAREALQKKYGISDI